MTKNVDDIVPINYRIKQLQWKLQAYFPNSIVFLTEVASPKFGRGWGVYWRLGQYPIFETCNLPKTPKESLWQIFYPIAVEKHGICLMTLGFGNYLTIKLTTVSGIIINNCLCFPFPCCFSFPQEA